MQGGWVGGGVGGWWGGVGWGKAVLARAADTLQKHGPLSMHASGTKNQHFSLVICNSSSRHALTPCAGVPALPATASHSA